jgi:hypothetical protein
MTRGKYSLTIRAHDRRMVGMATNSTAASMLTASQLAAQSSDQHRHNGQRTPSMSGTDAQGSNTASPSASGGKIGSRINIVV